MSLLIKALQKAEQGKSGRVEVADPLFSERAAALELTPQHDHELHAEAGFETTPAPVKPAGRTAQQTAAAVFAAKQEESPDEGASHAVTIALIGIAFLALVGGGFYFYLDSLNQPEIIGVRQAPVKLLIPPPAKPVAPPAAQPPLQANVPVAAPAPATEPPAMSTATAAEPSLPVLPPPAAASAETQKAAPPRLSPSPETPVMASNKPAVPANEEKAVKVTRNRNSASAVNSNVMAGYQAFLAGDDAAAKRWYRQAVQSDPRNIDALLGLGAVAAREDNADQAGTYFMQVLELEPRNATAQAGMINLTGQSDPQTSETRLKSMLAQQPEAAFLHAALGNLYAEQNQWPSAQQAYFQAYRYDADNPEYAFNLAVSLDQMGKAAPAAQHYERALELMARQGAAGLDRNQIESRIAQLRQTTAQ